MKRPFLLLIVILFLYADETRYLQALAFYYDDNHSNDAIAAQWLGTEAEAGNTDAAFLLAVAYHHGTLGQKSAEKALAWFEKGAKGGDVDAMMQTAWVYYRGEGVAQDLKKAISWFEAAREKGDEEAEKMLMIIDEEMESLF